MPYNINLPDRYCLIGDLGKTEFSTTYLVKDIEKERKCVIKACRQYDAAHRDQFEREAIILSKLNHPNLPKVYAYFVDSDSDQPYLVMQYIEGQDLEKKLGPDPVEPLPVVSNVLKWADHLLSALDYLHHQKDPIIHRDIKPSNICITPEGTAFLLDFGIARERTEVSPRSDAQHTLTGARAVTEGYAPIEQYSVDSVPSEKARKYVQRLQRAKIHTGTYSDIYSLGATLYFALTKNPPDKAWWRVIEDSMMPALKRNKVLPKYIVKALRRALVLHPKKRCQTVDQFKALLQPPSRRKITIRFALISLGLLIALLILGPRILEWRQQWGGTQLPAASHNTVTITYSAPVEKATEPAITPIDTETQTPLLPTLTSTPTWTPTPTASATPSPTPTVMPSLTPTATPFATIKDEKVDVYAGPGEIYGKIDQIKRDDQPSVICCLEDGEWLQIRYLGREGWIRTASAVLSGVPAVVTPQPTPTCEAPRIARLDLSSDTVDTMSAITLTCELTSSVGNLVTYTWASSGGVISGTGRAVNYWSDEIGTQTITATVLHKFCGQDERSIQIQTAKAVPPPGLLDPDPNTAWGRIWHNDANVRRTLRWATEEEKVTFGAQQRFQHGMMFWWDDKKGEIYVMTDDGQWQVYVGNWQEGMNEYTCPDVAGSRTPPTPRRGFGEIWCLELGGPDAAIGWAEQDEQGYHIHYRRFEHGLMWADIDGRIYIRYDDNTWEKPLDTSLLQIIDDFEVYVGDSALNEVYGIHDGWVNAGVLTLASPPDVFNGIRGAAFHYQIKSDQSDFAGFERTFAPQDWRGYSGLRVWVKGEGSGDLVIQFREAGGEVWKYRTSLSNLSAKDFWIPFDASALELDYWSDGPLPRKNEQIDLEAIDYYGFFVGHAGVGSGTIYVDNVRLVM